jgi:hypothetical protein
MVGLIKWNGFGRKRSWLTRDIIPEHACRDSGKPRKASVMIAEIGTEHLPNTSLGFYRYANPLRDT